MGQQLVYALVGALVIAGSAEAEDLGKRYSAYDAEFTAKHRPIIHVVPRDGHRIHAREYRPTGARSLRAPFILMHGFPDSVHLYDRLAPRLAKYSRVIAFDFLGWGKSDKPKDHRYIVASLRRDLEAVIAHFGVRRVNLVVHDASGLPGIDYALDNPVRTAGLILLNTLYAPSKNRVMPPSIKRFSTPGIWRDLSVFGANRSDTLWQDGLSTQIGEFFADPNVRDKYRPLFVHQALQIRPAFFGLTAVWHAEVQARAKRMAQLGKLSVPTKIIFGVKDPYLTPALARELNRTIPASKLYLVRSAGHYVQLDRPAEVAVHILGD